MGSVSNSLSHHAQAIFPSQDFPSVHHGGCVHGAHVAGLPAGVLANRHRTPDHAAVVTDAVTVDRVPGAGGLSRPVGRGHVPTGLSMETRSRT